MLGGLQTPGQYPVARHGARRSLKLPAPGFTLIEVMIVLAVTGLLFVSAAALISGKQNQTAFDQSIRQIQSQIQAVINEVSIGFYPNLGDIQCNGAGGTVTLVKASGTGQGANAGCIFLGKAMQFQVGSADPEEFNVYSIAGLQKGGPGGGESTSLTDAKPKIIAPSSAEPNLPDSTVNEALQNGLTTTKMWYDDGSGPQDIGLVAFVSSLASFDPATGAIVSGSTQVDVYPIDDGNIKSKLGQAATIGVDVLDSSALPSAVKNPKKGVFICFKSGGTNQYALITIGNNGRQLSVRLDVKSTPTCS